MYFELSVIVIGATLLSYFAVIGRLPVVIAYLLSGVVVGPMGLGFVKEIQMIDNVSEIGISLLLFLAGVELQPRRLGEILKRVSLVTAVTCIGSALLIFAIVLALDYGQFSAFLIALSLMFSSTILTIKLIPTTTLHNQYLGAYCIGILILQDIIAIGCLFFMNSVEVFSWAALFIMPLKAGALVVIAYILEPYLLRPIMRRCEPVAETLYLFPLGWCLGISLLSGYFGFSHEIGAFIAGLVFSRNPISQMLMEKLKLLRDFFLMLFFFSLGAKMNLVLLPKIAGHAFLLASAVIVFKVVLFSLSIRFTGESMKFSYQAAVRLAQASEFSIILAILAERSEMIDSEMGQLIQLVTILTFVFSSYLVSNLYRTPWSTPSLKL